jgi:integrase
LPKLVEGLADRLKVPEGKRDVQVFDDDLPGFGIRKFDSGRASYFVKYNVGPQQRRHTLGAVVRGNLKAMKLEASKVLAKARLGTDVVAVKRAVKSKQSTSLGDLVARYLDDRQPKLRPRYHAEIKRQLERDWKGLHQHAVESVTRQAVITVVDDIAASRGEVAADRARTALGGLSGWVIERGYCDANPTLNVSPRAGSRARERVLSAAELVEVWRACGEDHYGRIVRLLILTGQRRREIGDLAWLEVDSDKRQIDLPAERTKNHRPHVVPLSDQALALLPKFRVGRDLAFGHRDGGFSGWSKAKGELDARIAEARMLVGIKEQMPSWRLHDLRRSFVTHINELGFAQPHVVEAIVNHVSGHLAGVAGVYNKAQYLAERRKALELWGDHVLALVEGRTRKVVPIKARAGAASGRQEG